MRPLADNLVVGVASVIDDDVTTTDELIPSGESSSYRSESLPSLPSRPLEARSELRSPHRRFSAPGNGDHRGCPTEIDTYSELEGKKRQPT